MIVFEDGNFFVKFLPPDVTALIHSMDQEVIALMKKNTEQTYCKKGLNRGMIFRASGKTARFLTIFVT